MVLDAPDVRCGAKPCPVTATVARLGFLGGLGASGEPAVIVWGTHKRVPEPVQETSESSSLSRIVQTKFPYVMVRFSYGTVGRGVVPRGGVGEAVANVKPPLGGAVGLAEPCTDCNPTASTTSCVMDLDIMTTTFCCCRSVPGEVAREEEVGRGCGALTPLTKRVLAQR